MNVIKYALLLLLIAYAKSAKILAIFPFPSKSHSILGSALLKELATRGHEVTMMSPYPTKNPPKNYYDINLDFDPEENDKRMNLMMAENASYYQKAKSVINGITAISRGVLKNKNLQALLNKKPKFDLVIQLAGGNEAILVIGHVLNATTMGFSVIGSHFGLNEMTGNPSPYAYVPHTLSPYSEDMNFLERVVNTLMYVAGDVLTKFILRPYQRRLLKEFFPDAPSLEELIDSIDITLINSHVATESPRPLLPNLIQIGGFHLQEKQNLPHDLKKYLDESKNGVILFSFGTNVRSSQFSQDKMQAILKTFEKLDYDVLWKFDEELSDIPKNLKIMKWLPQRAVLEHKNVKAFITHGGLGSTVEAIFHGVPMVCIPFFGDQAKNVADSVKNGYAIEVDFATLTESSFTNAIREIISNKKYKEKALLKSDIYKNQEMNPMDKAVYWVEHVIKHKGAKHMKSRAAEIPFYQYFLLDVIGFLFVCISIVIALLFATVYGGVKFIKKIFGKYVCQCNSNASHKKAN